MKFSQISMLLLLLPDTFCTFASLTTILNRSVLVGNTQSSARISLFLFFLFFFFFNIIVLHCGYSSFSQKWQAAKDWSHYLQTLKIESRFIGRKQICLVIKPWIRIGTSITVYSFLILLIVNGTPSFWEIHQIFTVQEHFLYLKVLQKCSLFVVKTWLFKASDKRWGSPWEFCALLGWTVCFWKKVLVIFFCRSLLIKITFFAQRKGASWVALLVNAACYCTPGTSHPWSNCG